MNAAIDNAKETFAEIVRPEPFTPAPGATAGIEEVYARPLWAIIQQLESEFDAEWAERAEWRAQPGLLDFVVCGGIVDDARVRRAMHASHAQLRHGRPARAAGNRVFPNGWIECELAVPARGAFRLVIKGDPRASRGFRLVVKGTSRDVMYDELGYYEERIAPEATGAQLTVRLQKAGGDYPWFFALATIADPGASC